MHVSVAQEIIVSTRASHRPLLTEKLSPLQRRDDRSCAQSLPELKRSTDTLHVTQTSLQWRTAPNVEKGETGNNEIDQPGEWCQHNSFLPFTSTQKGKSFSEH